MSRTTGGRGKHLLMFGNDVVQSREGEVVEGLLNSPSKKIRHLPKRFGQTTLSRSDRRMDAR